MQIVAYTDNLRDKVIAFLHQIWLELGRRWVPRSVADADIYDIANIYQVRGGGFWVVLDEDRVVGTAALKYFSSEIGELKRCYVLPSHQAQGLGLRLYEIRRQRAIEVGFRKLRLDTNNVALAQSMLRRGFKEIQPYYHNPHAVMFLELEL